ncbi:MAG: hypothetical protein SNJ83_02795 [Aggregatilineales bacterium]
MALQLPIRYEQLVEQRTISEGAELWISGQVIREFIVQATHPRTLAEPLTIEQVVREIEAI